MQNKLIQIQITRRWLSYFLLLKTPSQLGSSSAFSKVRRKLLPNWNLCNLSISLFIHHMRFSYSADWDHLEWSFMGKYVGEGESTYEFYTCLIQIVKYDVNHRLIAYLILSISTLIIVILIIWFFGILFNENNFISMSLKFKV